MACHQRHDDARVDSARKQRAERHVGSEALRNGVAHGRARELEPVLVASRREGSGRRRPVALDALRLALGKEHVAGRHAVDAGNPGGIARHVLERQVRVERRHVDVAPHVRQAQERFQLGCKGERPVGETRPNERLLAEAVAREHESLPRPIPEREREHSLEAPDEVRPVLLVRVRQDRRIAGAADAVVAKLLPELLEVVELAVEDADDVVRLVGDRLEARGQVEHAEALMPEHATAVRVRRSLIRPAVRDCGAHRVDELGIRRARR